MEARKGSSAGLGAYSCGYPLVPQTQNGCPTDKEEPGLGFSGAACLGTSFVLFPLVSALCRSSELCGLWGGGAGDSPRREVCRWHNWRRPRLPLLSTVMRNMSVVPVCLSLSVDTVRGTLVPCGEPSSCVTDAWPRDRCQHT